MSNIGERNLIAIQCFRWRSLVLIAAAVAGSLSIVFDAGDASAQYFRGFRPRGAVVVAPPFYPSPYLGAPWPAPPIIAGPPSSVRIQTPFFSMNVGPGVFVPPPYSVYDYRYEAYRPHFDSDYVLPSERIPEYSDQGNSIQGNAEPPASGAFSYGRYRSGFDGGIPDLTVAEAFSPSKLRFAAETLERALSARVEDGDVWLEYLQPDRIIAAVDLGKLSPSVQELHSRFVGVTMNRELAAVTRINGFDQTLHQLGLWVEREATSSEPQVPPIQDASAALWSEFSGNGKSESSAGAEAQPQAQELLPAPVGEVDNP